MNTLWNKSSIQALYQLPLMELLYRAQSIHRQYHDPNEVELCTLLSIKTGTCPEDCGYCSQSGHHKTGLDKEKLMDVELVIQQAKFAKANGTMRFCMGAAWRNPPKKDFPKVLEMIKAVKALGMEACVTLGMLDEEQTQQLSAAGLDYYNHNLDTSPEYYATVTSTRTYQDRLDTLERVRTAGINVCCGGITGMGETHEDRISLLEQLANLPEPPQSVPINKLVPIKGTPLGESSSIDNIDFVRTVAVARIIMPKSAIRLSAGRNTMSEEMQALCFFAGANSIHYGDKLLTTPNPGANEDLVMLEKLGMKPKAQIKTDVAKACC